MRRVSTILDDCENEAGPGSRRLSVLGGRKQSELSEERDLSVGCKISDEGVLEHVSGKRRRTIFAS